MQSQGCYWTMEKRGKYQSWNWGLNQHRTKVAQEVGIDFIVKSRGSSLPNPFSKYKKVLCLQNAFHVRLCGGMLPVTVLVVIHLTTVYVSEANMKQSWESKPPPDVDFYWWLGDALFLLQFISLTQGFTSYRFYTYIDYISIYPLRGWCQVHSALEKLVLVLYTAPGDTKPKHGKTNQRI